MENTGPHGQLFSLTRTPAFEQYLAGLLVELCRIDSTPNADVSVMQRAESAIFDRLERELRSFGLPGLILERRGIDPRIATHPAYSLLHFTKTPARPRGLTPRQAYRNRHNLVCTLPAGGKSSGGVALNAHVDVVAPYFPPRVEDGGVCGRGACDDKGSVVAIVAALKVLAALSLRPPRPVTAMFAIEEETGGNGSLALALDRELKQRYESMLVGECTDLRVYPANRGAVWYQAELQPCSLPLLEAAAFVIEELEKEGRALRAESRHPLFPQRPVQTCHGIVGSFGEHPSRICGKVSFEITSAAPAAPALTFLVQDVLNDGLAEYTGLYGDKTLVLDPGTGRPKVERHYDLTGSAHGFRVTVYGATGHMGSILENDGAITKMAALVRALCRSRSRLEAVAGGRLGLALTGHDDGGRLVLEGGQGFLPTHDLAEVMCRMRRAAERGVAVCAACCGVRIPGRRAVRVSYEKLHNAAFDGDPASPAMRRALAAARGCGMEQDEPVTGWTVSCDARLFACEYPGMPVLTAGPGKLAHAHADQEQVRLADVRQFVEFLVLLLMER